MYNFKTFETPIWNGKQNSLTGPVITGSFEKRAPAPEANVREPIGEEPNRSFCDCRSACKTKQKNGVGRGCPCPTANLPCVQNRCKYGTGRKQCANRVSSFYYVYAHTLEILYNVQTLYQRNLPSSSMERQRRDIENTRQEIQVSHHFGSLGSTAIYLLYIPIVNSPFLLSCFSRNSLMPLT